MVKHKSTLGPAQCAHCLSIWYGTFINHEHHTIVPINTTLCWKCYTSLETYLMGSPTGHYDKVHYDLDESNEVQYESELAALHAEARKWIEGKKGIKGNKKADSKINYKHSVPAWMRSAIDQGMVEPNGQQVYVVYSEGNVAVKVEIIEPEDIAVNRIFEENKQRLFAYDLHTRDLAYYEATHLWREHCKIYNYPFIHVHEKRTGHASLFVSLPNPKREDIHELQWIFIPQETGRYLLNLLKSVPYKLDYTLKQLEENKGWQLLTTWGIRTRKSIPTSDALALATDLVLALERAGYFPGEKRNLDERISNEKEKLEDWQYNRPQETIPCRQSTFSTH